MWGSQTVRVISVHPTKAGLKALEPTHNTLPGTGPEICSRIGSCFKALGSRRREHEGDTVLHSEIFFFLEKLRKLFLLWARGLG